MVLEILKSSASNPDWLTQTLREVAKSLSTFESGYSLSAVHQWLKTPAVLSIPLHSPTVSCGYHYHFSNLGTLKLSTSLSLSYRIEVYKGRDGALAFSMAWWLIHFMTHIRLSVNICLTEQNWNKKSKNEPKLNIKTVKIF
jgi:hypothetical protein